MVLVGVVAVPDGVAAASVGAEVASAGSAAVARVAAVQVEAGKLE